MHLFTGNSYPRSIDGIVMSTLLTIACFLFAAVAVALPKADHDFANPIGEGADPWVVEHKGKFYWCFSKGNRGITIWVSDRLTSLGTPHLVWEAPKNRPYSLEVWAPELHFLDGRWYVYFAASDGQNKNHLAYALESEGKDPLGPYTLRGPFATGDGKDGFTPNIWAIDMTILEHEGNRYAIWSGWNAPGTDQQYLYIAPMSDPVTLSGPRVLMAGNDDFIWERTEERLDSRGLHEAPQVLQNKGRTFVTYSCGASWLTTYKLGILELTGSDPLDPKSWTKQLKPVFTSHGPTQGVGHSSFIPSPDLSEWWHIYHAKVDQAPGWRRAVFVQPFAFDDQGFPDFGTPVAPCELLPIPSGQVTPESPSLPFYASLNGSNAIAGFSYFGHQQMIGLEDDGLYLGVLPHHPINTYRSGEKLVLNDGRYENIEVSADIRVLSGNRDAGILIRVNDPAVGFDAQRGYFAGYIPGNRRVIFGSMDGAAWRELARADADVGGDQEYKLTVRANGTQFTVLLNGHEVITLQDSQFASGSVGLRVVDTHARFRNLRIEPLGDSEE